MECVCIVRARMTQLLSDDVRRANNRCDVQVRTSQMCETRLDAVDDVLLHVATAT